MIRVTLQKYHLKNNPSQKRAALIYLLQAATDQNIHEYQNKLGLVLREDYDCYILIVAAPDAINAFTLKLLVAFRNTIPEKVGLLLNDSIRSLVAYAKLDTFFLIDESPGKLIARIETQNKGEKKE